MTPLIKVGMLISYDYRYACHSLPLIYPHADRITLAVDHECKTWAGQPYEIDSSFWAFIRELDTEKKIAIYRDNFHLPELTTIENDTRERQLLADYMGTGGWHVQIDSDEYFLDFASFATFLRNHARLTSPTAPPINIGAFWIPLVRQVNGGFVYAAETYERFPVATNKPAYTYARNSLHPYFYSRACVFHQTWARPASEVRQKLENWGHSHDFHVQSYFALWQAIDRYTCQYLRDMHPLIPSAWPRLAWSAGEQVEDFMIEYVKNNPSRLPMKTYMRRQLGRIRQKFRRTAIHL
jgi:hypothetical protein